MLQQTESEVAWVGLQVDVATTIGEQHHFVVVGGTSGICLGHRTQAAGSQLELAAVGGPVLAAGIARHGQALHHTALPPLPLHCGIGLPAASQPALALLLAGDQSIKLLRPASAWGLGHVAQRQHLTGCHH